ncbi:MAG: DEAD/DEAH box helicase, partial [Thermoleophilia bacterium]|nr:DEAD/DEAH box helicase [Thermoleophilia bacterium]
MSPLTEFSVPVRTWFADTFGDPTPPQALGWPPIQRGEHTLILAPTGSGKTLTAFLWGIDDLFRGLTRTAATDTAVARPGAAVAAMDAPAPGTAATDAAAPPGVRLVYISPLKALNNDIQRNLRIPLAGVRAAAAAAGLEWPEIRVAVRSGDTPQRERRALLSRPPHILITTPESLYLLLTSPRAREIVAPVRTVIVDEIHTLAGNKRGVHLSVSLERLKDMTARPIQRIGLSATIRPLEEVARFLGGAEWAPDGDGSGGARDEGGADVPAEPGAGPRGGRLVARPVTIVDAGHQKPLDLRVETLTEDYRGLPGGSVWPVVIPRVLDLIRQHRTTLVFTNNRRLAERTADRLNEQAAAESRGEISGLIVDGVAKGVGFMAAGTGVARGELSRAVGTVTPPDPAGTATPSPVPAGAARGPSDGSGSSDLPPFRAHHGSMARDARLEMERDLKAGRTRALVGTSSLELGIDIGTVDLVVQLQSPASVAQGLQRVGRSG